MEKPLQIAYRDITRTDAIDDLIRKKAAKLEQVYDHMTSCEVVVEKPQRHQNSGSPFRVRIDMRVPPGHELVVRHEPGDGEMHESLESVIRSTFDSAWRKLKRLKEKQQGETKTHSNEPT